MWASFFGFFHLKNFKLKSFQLPNVVELVGDLQAKGLITFLISYFFFNNAVISIFAFASMFAAFLFEMSEAQILFLGIFINLFGIFGCLILGKNEDKFGSLKTVQMCIIGLLISTAILFFIDSVLIFWILALLIGFFVGPIQASSRSVIVKKIKAQNQLVAFSIYSMFGNLCSILGPFLVGLTIDLSDSIRFGLLVIPIFFAFALIPYYFSRTKINV